MKIENKGIKKKRRKGSVRVWKIGRKGVDNSLEKKSLKSPWIRSAGPVFNMSKMSC